MNDRKKSVALVPSTQAEMPLIARKVENRLVHQRAIDGYFNATAMCQAAGKLFGHYYENRHCAGDHVLSLAER